MVILLNCLNPRADSRSGRISEHLSLCTSQGWSDAHLPKMCVKDFSFSLQMSPISSVSIMGCR